MKTPPGRCFLVALGIAVAMLLGLVFGGEAGAEPPKKKSPEAKAGGAGGDKPESGKAGNKEKTYTFGGLDIDGKLKTPQLLYFLNRMKSEFDTTTPERRSFIPELKRSTDEM